MIVDIYLTVRLKSSRLPQKALAKIEGQSIIEHIIDRAKTLKKATNIILCTSTNEQDSPLEEIANKKNISCFRGSEDNIIKRFLGAAESTNPDIIVRITGDNCLFSPEFIDYAIDMHRQKNVDYTSTKELAGGSKGDVLSYSALKKIDGLLKDERASEYLSWLLADKDNFNVQWLTVDESIKRPQYRLHCDTPQDLEFLKQVYQHLYDGQNIIPYAEVIKFLDNHPEIVKINSDIKQISLDQVKDEINFELKK